ncbi:hypothetical protein LINGRAHAP2_LOCUS6640 [Linum grandiflorum]
MASVTSHWHLLLLSVTMVCLLTPTVSSQIQGCSIQGLDIGQCFKPVSNHESCCKVLNKAVRAGYNCLCLLLGSSDPLLSPSSLSSPLSHCSISVPSLTHCHANGSSEAPGLPFSPKHKASFWPQSPSNHLLNPTGDGRNTVETPADSADHHYLTIANVAALDKISSNEILLISIAIHAFGMLGSSNGF